MSTSVFPVAFLRPPAADYFESTAYLEENERSQGGWFAAINRASSPIFRCSGLIRLPYGTTTADTFLDFVEALSGTVDTFLYRAVLQRNRVVTGGALGTGTGSKTAFAFSAGTSLHRHIINGNHSDEVTLKVYVSGVLQTLTTHYTVSGNDTDLTVTFVAAPALAAAITVDYLFYIPVRFVSSDFSQRVLQRQRGDALTGKETVEFAAALEEDRAGRRYA